MSPSRRRAIMKSAYVLLVTALILVGFTHWHYDDPYITYRYANNIADGLGFVYNEGERVLSTTTPLFTLLLAVLSPAWNDLPSLANLIGAISLAVGGLILWELAQAWNTPGVGWAGLLVYPAFPLLLTTLGSETPLYLSLCLAAFLTYAVHRYRWTAALSALVFLTRPDGVLLAVLLGTAILVNELAQQCSSGETFRAPGLTLQAGLVFLAITLPWLVFAQHYFGSPAPVTLMAKQYQGLMPVSQDFFSGFLNLAGSYAQRRHYQVEAALALAGLWLLFGRGKRWSILLAWVSLHFTAYSFLGVPSYYWYYAPLVLGLVVLAGMGLQWLGDRAWDLQQWLRRHHQPTSAARWQVQEIILLAAASLSISQAKSAWEASRQPDSRYQIFRAAGEWLRENTSTDSRVGAMEVGILGYYGQRKMIDFAGLIQPQVALQLGRETTYDDAAQWAVESYQPDYLVLLEDRFPVLQSQILRVCYLAQRLAGAAYGFDEDLLIYGCSGTQAGSLYGLHDLQPAFSIAAHETGYNRFGPFRD